MKKCMFNKLVYIKNKQGYEKLWNTKYENYKWKKSITPADVTTDSELYMLQEILELGFR